MDTSHEPSLPPAPPTPIELGTRIGQAQAFGWVARACSAAGAQRLKQIKEDRSYESLGLTWDQFCEQHAGISRAQADKLIERLDEFGESYFQLSAVTRISPESYRLLAPAVTAAGIEVDGETIPLTPENAPRIRHAILALRTELRRAQVAVPDAGIIQLQIRLDACFDQISRLVQNPDLGTRAAARGLIDYTRNKLNRLAESLRP